MPANEVIGGDKSRPQPMNAGPERPSARMLRRLLPLGISVLILVAIYWEIDLRAWFRGFARSEPQLMTLSLAMVVPITLLTARRLQLLVPAPAPIGFIEANRLILAASTFNMVLPAKMGDIVKAYFMARKGALSAALSFSIVVVEKAADTLALLLWCAFGLALYPQKDALFWTATMGVIVGLAAGTILLGSRKFARLVFNIAARVAPAGKIDNVRGFEAAWCEVHEFVWRDKLRLSIVSLQSVFLWFLHLLQIWLFILALRGFAPFLAAVALAPLAIFAGLVPLTFAGVGTRDAALIFLFRPYLDLPTAAALGVLCTARYFIPAVAGLPFLHRYLEGLSEMRISEFQKQLGR
jgi:glycosyltransferase 2 family protein